MKQIRVYHDEKTCWDDMCVWCLENVGLPNGDTWMYHPTSEYMDFDFAKETDAIHFSLLWL